METLKKLCEEERATVLTVIPIELAERYATRIVALSGGEIAFDISGRLADGSRTKYAIKPVKQGFG